jgi:hypothetical protein
MKHDQFFDQLKTFCFAGSVELIFCFRVYIKNTILETGFVSKTASPDDFLGEALASILQTLTIHVYYLG